MIRALVFSAANNGFTSVISIFCCSVSVVNISLHFQTLILTHFRLKPEELWQRLQDASRNLPRRLENIEITLW